MKVEVCIYSQLNYLPRTAIGREQKQFIKIAFAVHLSAVISAERYRSDSGALKSAVLHFVFFVMLKNKIEQSAKRNSLLKKPTDRTFENRWSRYKELGKKVPQTYRVYVEDTFLPCDAVIARIFSKEMTHTDNQGDNEEQKVKRYYYHSDHLGSAQFVTDWKGRQYEHIEYTPYGELWIEEVAAGLDKLPFRFTGKELDEETGLYYYGARYLDPKYSRWLSGDPALGEYMAGSSVGEGGIYNTVNFNVYHYGSNNPIKYTDPTGRYDKEEYKAFKALTRQEKNVILSSISKSKTVNRMANEAWDKTNVTFGGNGRYDQSDAFRHGYWMGRNTQEAGEKFTRKFGDAHEYATNPDPKEFPRNDIIMDIHNNDVGIEVGKKNPTATPEELAKKILEKINNGDMLIMNDKTGLLYKSNDTEYKNPLSVDDPFIRRPDVSKKIADYILKDQKTEEVKE
ncbi:RHS repeat domain-containing protein [Treponema denticola]|uniref:RHS repeat domain-containing protein n=1 Tax=Treponema denticola TaxID=158 RepID=UPI003D6EDF35